jgi:hypothetical protein
MPPHAAAQYKRYLRPVALSFAHAHVAGQMRSPIKQHRVQPR